MNQIDLKNKVAIVTGGVQGFGLAVVKRFIESTSHHNNPSEVSNKGKVHQLQRNSKENIKNWKKRLSNKEIKIIRDITEHISNKFYTNKDW